MSFYYFVQFLGFFQAIAGERACYNSILCFSNQILVLGTKSVHALTIRSWHERLDYLVKQGHFVDALQLGYDLYLEKAKAVVGLKGNKNSKRLVVREKVRRALPSFSSFVVHNCDGHLVSAAPLYS